jgi:hypothetical protein
VKRQTKDLRFKPAFAFRLAHGFPFSDGLDLAGTGFTVGAVGACLGLAEHPFVKLLLAA